MQKNRQIIINNIQWYSCKHFETKMPAQFHKIFHKIILPHAYQPRWDSSSIPDTKFYQRQINFSMLALMVLACVHECRSMHDISSHIEKSQPCTLTTIASLGPLYVCMSCMYVCIFACVCMHVCTYAYACMNTPLIEVLRLRRTWGIGPCSEDRRIEAFDRDILRFGEGYSVSSISSSVDNCGVW